MTIPTLQQSYQLIDDIGNWTKDKGYNYPNISVQTYHKVIDDEYWCGRSNVIQDDDTQKLYPKFLKYLIGVEDGGDLQMINHTRYEKEYIHSLQSYKLLPIDDVEMREKGYIQVQLIYDIGVIFKKREFIEYILIQPPVEHQTFNDKSDPDEEISLIISIPHEDYKADDDTSNNNTVRAMYHSIERVIYNKRQRTIQWDMITTSDAKGCLPLWLQKMGINKSISADVPSFIQFIKTHPHKEHISCIYSM